jgi:hypothetical protein
MRAVILLISTLLVIQLEAQHFNRLYDFDPGDLISALSIEYVENDVMVFCLGRDTVENTWVSPHVLKLDASGEILTHRNYFQANSFIWCGFWSSTTLLENGTIAMASAIEYEEYSNPALILFDSEADSLAFHEYQSVAVFNDGSQVNSTADGGFIIGGYTYDGENVEDPDSHYFLLKTDSEGNEEWRQTYGGPGVEWGRFVLACPDSGYIVGGTSASWNTNPDNFYAHDRYMVKTDSLGNVEWEKIIATEFNDGGTGLCPGHDDEHFYEFGWYPWDAPEGNTLNTYNQPRITKWTYEGDEVWTKLYGPISFIGGITSMKLLSDGGMIVTGAVTYSDENPEEELSNQIGYLLRLDASGDSLWMHTYEHPFNEGPLCFGGFYDVTETPDGFAACGVAMSYENEEYFQRAWVIRTDECGNLLEEDCWLGSVELKIETAQPLLYPNPANTGFSIVLPQDYSTENLMMVVYNMQGQCVLQTSLKQSQNYYDVERWTAGLYFINVLSENQILWTTKLIKQ